MEVNGSMIYVRITKENIGVAVSRAGPNHQ
jgi:hypothetical protein